MCVNVEHDIRAVFFTCVSWHGIAFHEFSKVVLNICLMTNHPYNVEQCHAHVGWKRAHSLTHTHTSHKLDFVLQVSQESYHFPAWTCTIKPLPSACSPTQSDSREHNRLLCGSYKATPLKGDHIHFESKYG